MSHIVWLLPIIIAILLIVGSKAGSPARNAGYVLIAGLVGWHICSAMAARDVARLKQKLEIAIYNANSATDQADDKAAIAENAHDAEGAALARLKASRLAAIAANIRSAIEHSRAVLAESRAASADRNAKDAEGKIHDLEKKPAHRVVARCPLSADDARSLRGIPGASTSR